MAEAIKTIKIKIVSPNKGKEKALESTVEILNKVLSFYIDLTLLNRSLLREKKESVNKKTGEVRLCPLHNVLCVVLVHEDNEAQIRIAEHKAQT